MPPFGNLYCVPVYVDVALTSVDEIVIQAATLHGPADVRIGVLHDESRTDDWTFARWLPHRVDGDAGRRPRWALATGALRSRGERLEAP